MCNKNILCTHLFHAKMPSRCLDHDIFSCRSGQVGGGTVSHRQPTFFHPKSVEKTRNKAIRMRMLQVAFLMTCRCGGRSINLADAFKPWSIEIGQLHNLSVWGLTCTVTCFTCIELLGQLPSFGGSFFSAVVSWGTSELGIVKTRDSIPLTVQNKCGFVSGSSSCSCLKRSRILVSFMLVVDEEGRKTETPETTSRNQTTLRNIQKGQNKALATSRGQSRYIWKLAFLPVTRA